MVLTEPRQLRSAPIHVPTLEWQLGRIGKTIDELVDSSRCMRHPVSRSTFYRALRGEDLHWRSRAGIADVIELSLEQLECGVHGANAFQPSTTGWPDGEIHRALGPAFSREAQRMIRATSLVDLRNVEIELRRFSAGPAAARFESFYEDLARQAARLSNLASLRPKHPLLRSEGHVLRIHCPQTLFTTLLLLEYLRQHERIRADIDLYTQHSTLDLLDHLQQNICDEVVALPLVTAVLYYQHTPEPLYRPIALLPRGSHRLVDLARERSCKREVVLLPGTATAPAYFLALRRHGVLKDDAMGVPCDPKELIRSSEVEATSAVLWFPRNVIYEVLQHGRYLDEGELEIASKESVLLMRKDLLENERLVDELLFSLGKAHATLTAQPELIPLLVRAIFEQPDYRMVIASEVSYAAFLAG
jgi:hypothetical protein